MKIKPIYSLLILLATSTVFYAQVGINTATPASSLDIVAKNATGTSGNVDGLLVPRVDRERAQNMTAASIPVSTMIYVNNAVIGQQNGLAVNIDAVGYYYFNGTAWVKLHNPNNAIFSNANIYNSNGALSENRTVTTAGNQLNFNGPNSSVIVGTANTEGRVSIAGSTRASVGLTSGTSVLNLFQDSGSLSQITATGASTGLNVSTSNATPLNFLTNGTSKMTITSGGNIGIGLNNPTNRLHITATADPLRLEGTTAGVTTTDRLMVMDGTGVVKTIGTLGGLSIPNPAIFRLETIQTDFLNGVGAGGSSVVPMSVIKNTIPGMTYNATTSTITFPVGTYQMTLVYEALHNATGCTISSYFVDFPLNATTQRVHNTSSHIEGGLANHGNTITYATTLPAGRTWQIRLGRGQSGNCSGAGMNLIPTSTQLLVFRIGD